MQPPEVLPSTAVVSGFSRTVDVVSGFRRTISCATLARLTTALVVAPFVLVLWGYVAGPLLATLFESLHGIGGGFAAYLQMLGLSGAVGESILGSILVSSLSVISSCLVGAAFGIALNRWDVPLRRLWQVALLLPLVLPPLMGVRAFDFLFGIGGVIPQLLGQIFATRSNTFAIDGLVGVLLVHTVTMYPFTYLTVSTAMRQLDDSLEEAAMSLGSSSWHCWRRVVVPSLTPAIVAGALLTFVSAMGSYTAPLLFHVDAVMTRQIAIAKVNGHLGLASAISMVLALVALAFVVLMRRYEQRRPYRSVSKGALRRQPRTLSIRGRAALTTVLGAMALFLLLPIALIVIVAFSVNGSWRASLLPTRYTMDNFLVVVSDPVAWSAMTNSIVLSACAAVAIVLFGVLGAYVVARMRSRGRDILDVAMMLPWALPGTVVAVNLIAAFAHPSSFSFGYVLVGTPAIVALAYFVRFSPIVYRSTAASLAQIDPALEDAARGLGATWWTTFTRVVLPLLAPSIAAGALLAFVDGMGEYVATTLLSSTHVTMSIAIEQELAGGNFGSASALGTIQVVLAALVVAVMARRFDRA
jgi:iron(III) transport system permease protein